MAVAKIARSNFDLEKVKKRLKKGAKGFIGRIFPTQTERSSQIDYSAIPQALKRKKKQEAILKEMDANVIKSR